MRALIVLLFLIGGCKSQLNSSTVEVTKEASPEELNVTTNVNQKPRADEVPASHARVIAEVLQILPIASDTQFPCSEYPCKAKIKIESVIGYGHSFGGPLQEDMVLEVYFPFTLKPTEEVFPKREMQPLPGLSGGDRFQADLRSSLSIGQGSSYQIKTYTKK